MESRPAQRRVPVTAPTPGLFQSAATLFDFSVPSGNHLHPNAGRPVTASGVVVGGGRRVGYLDDMLIRLADLADWSEAHDRIIVGS